MNKFIFGKNSVLDAIKNNFPIKKLYLSKNINFGFSTLFIILFIFIIIYSFLLSLN